MRVLGVNGGNGVILHPFKNELVANIEPRGIFKTPKDIQWQLNFKDIPYLQKLSRDFMPIDIIIGGPDCGHSSVLSYSRAKKLSDPKENKSMRMYTDALRIYKPKMFLMENLPKMLDGFPQLMPWLKKKYHVIPITESVSYWGNSQINRVRLVLIGIRKDVYHGEMEENLLASLENLPVKMKSSGELIKGLEKLQPEICHIREPHNYEIPLYYDGQRKMTTLQAQEIWNTKFRNKSRWEVNMDRMKNQPGVYKNLENETPKTVRKQSRQFNHRGEMLSPREIARIQGIPDTFKLWFDPSRWLYCINKARATCAKSPPYEISKWFKDNLPIELMT